jgi:prolyl-tRNA editing enzyme YbaK/EbsC (Cys-tRNA(Pro) deacylase)
VQTDEEPTTEDGERRDHPLVVQVARHLEALGADTKPVMLSDTAHTAVDAARALGCEVGQIAKSLVFRGRTTDRALLVIARGTHRVSEGRLADLAGESVEQATADFVKARTGFPVGGVPPLGHRERLPTWIDEGLLAEPVIWAAAGHPRAVVRLTPAQLVAWTGGIVADVTLGTGQR